MQRGVPSLPIRALRSEGGMVATHPMVAKNPAVMAPGNRFTSSFKLESEDAYANHDNRLTGSSDESYDDHSDAHRIAERAVWQYFSRAALFLLFFCRKLMCARIVSVSGWPLRIGCAAWHP